MYRLLFGVLAALLFLTGCPWDRTQEVEPEADMSLERREPESPHEIPGGRLPEEGVVGTPMTPPDMPSDDAFSGAGGDQIGPPPAETTAGEQSLGEPIQPKQSQEQQLPEQQFQEPAQQQNQQPPSNELEG